MTASPSILRARRLRLVAAFAPLVALSLACSFFEEDEADPPPPPPPPVVPSAPAADTPPAPAADTPPAPVAFDPRATGTRVLARYQNGETVYAAVVTSLSGSAQVNVVYADGDSETLAADSLVPDSLREGTPVQARIRTWPQFYPGRLERRVGHAAFVRFEDGDQQWTSIGLVRAAASDIAPNTPETPLPPSVAIPQIGAPVLANFQQRGWYYAGVIVETRADGYVHVIYADGDREWLAPADVRPDGMQTGARVSCQPRGVPQPFEAVVRRRVGHAVEVQLDDGAKQWVALPNVRMR